MSDNNPWGQGRMPNRPNKGGSTPPDFDNLLSEFKKKFDRFFGGNGGGNKNKVSLLLVFFLIILFIFWLLGGIYKVETSQQAVELWFGRYHTTKTAGLRYHLPYPIQSVAIVDTEQDREIHIGTQDQANNSTSAYSSKYTTRRYNSHENQMLTGDENIVNIGFMIRWKIDNPRDYLFKVSDPEKTIYAVSESVMREIVGKNNVDDILTDGRGRIEADVKQKIQTTLDAYEIGVEISQVAIRESSPPESVKKDFNDVQAARVDADRFVEEATRLANKIIPEARGQKEKLLQEAQGYKEKAVAEAQGETSRFNKVYSEYRKAPYVTKKRLALETIENVYKDKKKLFLSGEGGAGVVPFLPVQKFMNKAN